MKRGGAFFSSSSHLRRKSFAVKRLLLDDELLKIILFNALPLRADCIASFLFMAHAHAYRTGCLLTVEKALLLCQTHLHKGKERMQGGKGFRV